jgi:hypothetical protein
MKEDAKFYFVALKLFLISLILVSPGWAQAQSRVEHDSARYSNTIAIVPQYAALHGIRIDYARRLKNNNQWLVFAPQFYSDINTNLWFPPEYYGSYQSMAGAGINLYYQIVVFKSAKINRSSYIPRQSVYFSVGPNFQYFGLKNEEEVAYPFEEDGITYYRFRLEEVRKSVYRVGAIIDFGYRLTLDRFLLELYTGVAVKYSMDSDGQRIDGYYDDWTNITYSGILLDGGLKLGFFF